MVDSEKSNDNFLQKEKKVTRFTRVTFIFSFKKIVLHYKTAKLLILVENEFPAHSRDPETFMFHGQYPIFDNVSHKYEHIFNFIHEYIGY